MKELDRAFGAVSKDMRKELRGELKDAAEPVRSQAESLAVGNISNIGGSWARMRVGATSRMAYVAPASKRSGGSPRPNLAPLLMDKAMQPALDANTAEVIARLERMIDRIGNSNGF